MQRVCTTDDSFSQSFMKGNYERRNLWGCVAKGKVGLGRLSRLEDAQTSEPRRLEQDRWICMLPAWPADVELDARVLRYGRVSTVQAKRKTRDSIPSYTDFDAMILCLQEGRRRPVQFLCGKYSFLVKVHHPQDNSKDWVARGVRSRRKGKARIELVTL